jgi:zinc protease
MNMMRLGQILFVGLCLLPGVGRASQMDFHLNNGMRVILVEDHHAPVVSYVLVYASGSIDDPAGKTGLAHFTEHLVLTRTGEAATRYQLAVERCGGVFNASTGHDAIRFYATVPAANLLEVLSYEAERMKAPRFTVEGLETERNVVEQERAQGHEDRPYGLAEDYLDEMAASREAYRHPVIGYPRDIKAYTYEDASHFVERHYLPKNATLVLVGDIAAVEVASQLRRLFGGIAGGEGSRAERVVRQFDGHGDYTTNENRAKRPRLYITFPLPPRSSRDAAAVMLLDNILVQGPHARLRQALVESDLAIALSSDFEFRRDGGLYYLIVTLRNEKDAEVAKQAIEKIVQEIVTQGVAEPVLHRSRLALRADQAIKAESSMYRATQIGLGTAIFSDPSILEHLRSYQEQITSAELSAAAARYFDGKHRVTLVAQPVYR